MTFGERLRHFRELRGFTQEQLAAEIGVAKTTITGYERGNRKPDVTKIRKLANALSVSGSELLGIEQEQEESPAPAEAGTGEISPEQSNNLLVALGYIKPGEQISDADLGFLEHVIGLLDAWFDKGR